MIIGFTGTRDGMTKAQTAAFTSATLTYHQRHDFAEFHHGVCVGADEEAVRVVRALPPPDVLVVAHPPIVKTLMSNPALMASNTVTEAKSYLPRNRDIVAACDLLIACPKSFESSRGGTYYTINRADEAGVAVLIIYPDGSLKLKNAPQGG